MTNKTSKTVVPFLHKLIKTEIAGSGLKAGFNRKEFAWEGPDPLTAAGVAIG
jgi:hypothetical protein